MGNGGTERFNRTLGSMLRTLPLKDKEKWPQQIQSLTFAYNATVHETTGYAPFFLMFGRIPRLPVDVVFRHVLNDPDVADYDSYAKSLLSSLKSAIEIAQKHSSTEQQHQAQQYNKRVKGTYLSVGDRVLVANKGERGKKKLADTWENGVYTVVDVKPDIHVYTIQDTAGRTRVVHRNLLLGVNFLPVSEQDSGTDTHSLDVSVEDEVSDSAGHGSDDGESSLFAILPQDISEHDLSHPLDGRQSTDSPVVVSTSPVIDDPVQRDPPASSVGAVSDDSLSAPVVTTTRHADLRAQTGSDSQVKTRAGRLVKSVNRLIESMVQVPFLKGSNFSFTDR
ncbi:uncharacterized protein LOC112139697 [Oryzias melastigma]|uniref:uncharacterized protein LOC112139697 n=1 Tax=Oryzias melastigma TaxID=30732 RepID=UPI000CF7E4EE|nr:uncharacterized protein LOC112139697 [Oryzias melastigma]